MNQIIHGFEEALKDFVGAFTPLTIASTLILALAFTFIIWILVKKGIIK